MAEYIEKEKALAFQNELEPLLCRSAATGEVFSATKDADIVAYLQSIPAADVREVVKAKWVNLTPPEFRTDGESVYWMCSECRNAAVFLAEDLPYNFCPNCGADMRDTNDV